MAWVNLCNVKNAWYANGSLLWSQILTLQINITGTNAETLTTTYDLRVICNANSAEANQGSTAFEIWMGPNSYIPESKDTAGKYHTSPYYYKQSSVYTFTDGKVIRTITGLTIKHSSDGTASLRFGLAFWPDVGLSSDSTYFRYSGYTYTFPTIETGNIYVYNNGWKHGQAYIYNNGWKKASKVDIYSNGWKQAK